MQKKSILYEIMGFEFLAEKFCILLREYLSSAVNVLTNTLNISVQTKADFFLLNLPRIHEERG